MTCAVFTVRILPTALASFAAILERSRFGTAMAAATRITPASTPPLLLVSRNALSSPYAAITTVEGSTVVCENDSAIAGDTCRSPMAASAAGSS